MSQQLLNTAEAARFLRAWAGAASAASPAWTWSSF